MLMPVGPTTHQQIGEGNAGSGGLCSRYPKTCAASEELYASFKIKAAYAFSIAHEAFDAHMRRADRTDVAAEAPHRAPHNVDWRRQPPQQFDYRGSNEPLRPRWDYSAN